VAADVAALAAILEAQGKDAEAEALYRRALAIFARLYGPDHYEVAVNSNNLAALLHARGAHVEAERLYQRVLAMKEQRRAAASRRLPGLAGRDLGTGGDQTRAGAGR
jgi:tetratricopeptide (TPR) repeat protein